MINKVNPNSVNFEEKYLYFDNYDYHSVTLNYIGEKLFVFEGMN